MRVTFFGLLLTVILFSCSKNNYYPSLGTLSVDIDGVPTSFTNCKAYLEGTDSSGSLYLYAETADSSSNLTIILHDYHAPVSLTTYNDSSFLDYQLGFEYFQQEVPHYNGYFIYGSGDTSNIPTANITITAVDSLTTSYIIDSIRHSITYPSSLRGTFNSKFIFLPVNNPNIPLQHALTHILTNGKFNLPNALYNNFN